MSPGRDLTLSLPRSANTKVVELVSSVKAHGWYPHAAPPGVPAARNQDRRARREIAYHGLLHLLGDDGAEFMPVFSHSELESLDRDRGGSLRRLSAARPWRPVGAA